MAGNYMLSVALMMLGKLDNPEVTVVLSQHVRLRSSVCADHLTRVGVFCLVRLLLLTIAFNVQVLTDLVQGEFMQLGSKEKEDERFSHYLDKSFKKTASLIANSCQAVAILGGADKMVQQMCYQYGRNVGIAFQLVDDFLDFAASSNVVGKPTAVDLRLGMATAPVLFACEKFPELIPMILRRFSEPGDVEFAMECVHRSDGLQQTKLLATQHCLHAISMLQQLAPSQEKLALIAITDRVINRIK
ncbi:hypothetical protein HAZT_HAZT002860 [Hyalella azteca]|uniref:Uncharacterized protein n=1 Tax=Hyalella azteca TaxID=294128 RepID=A0A6A0HAL8_HYAAZ|nr:hypothetical protein HAZT_HAZT002860 [Hyalella azteca]